MNPPRSRSDVLAAGVLVLVALGLWMPRLTGPLDLRYDAGVYYILGTALAEGHGYRLLNEPGAIEAIQYPPLLPLIVAAHERLTGTSDPAVTGQALRWTFAVLFAVYVVAVHRFCRRWLTGGWAFVATLLVLLHLQLTWLSDLLFAELPFALCTVLFLLVADARERRWTGWLLGAAAYLLRSTGLAVLAAWVADAVFHRRFGEAAWRIALAALPVLTWQLYIGGVQRSPEYRAPAYAYQRAAYQYYNVGYLENMSYLDPFAPERGLATRSELAARVTENLLALPVALGESVSGDADWVRGALRRLPVDLVPPWAVHVPFGLLGAASLVGHGLLLARGAWLGALYWTGSLLLIALTPWPAQFGRYLMPLAPLTALGLVTTLATVATAWPRRGMRPAIATVIGGILLFQALVASIVFRQQYTPAAGGHRRFFYDDAWYAHDTAGAWLGNHAAAGAIVATSTPHWIHLMTGLPAIFPPFEADVRAAGRLLEAVPVDYLVIDDLAFVDLTRRYAAPVVTAFPERWTLVYGQPDQGSRIYRRAGSRSAP